MNQRAGNGTVFLPARHELHGLFNEVRNHALPILLCR